MRYLLLIYIIIVFIISSCKKKFTCECSTLNTSNSGAIYVNEETYKVKEKSRTDAQISCAKMYEASGKATNGVNCEVKN